MDRRRVVFNPIFGRVVPIEREQTKVIDRERWLELIIRISRRDLIVDVKPKYGPLITPFLTNELHYRISSPSQSTLAATASPAAPAKAYGSPRGASCA